MQIIMFNSGFSQPEDKGILLKDMIEGGTIDKEFVDRDKSYCIDANYHKGGNPKNYFEKSRRQLVFPDKETCESLRPCELRDTPPAESALCHHVATATDIKANEANKRIYADTGKSPTVTTMGGGHREPKVLVSFVNDNDRVNAITENDRGYRPHKNDASKSGISELGRILKPNSKTDTVTTTHAPKMAMNSDITNLKYRKLTPRECMRLQGFTEEIIDKLLNAGISNSQLYKMTGNSFTLPVIVHNLQCLLDTGWPHEN